VKAQPRQQVQPTQTVTGDPALDAQLKNQKVAAAPKPAQQAAPAQQPAKQPAKYPMPQSQPVQPQPSAIEQLGSFFQSLIPKSSGKSPQAAMVHEYNHRLLSAKIAENPAMMNKGYRDASPSGGYVSPAQLKAEYGTSNTQEVLKIIAQEQAAMKARKAAAEAVATAGWNAYDQQQAAQQAAYVRAQQEAMMRVQRSGFGR
jgi:hypothetical protein